VGQALARRLALLQRQWPGHTIFSDGVHLNAVGCQIVAMQVLQAFGVLKVEPMAE